MLLAAVVCAGSGAWLSGGPRPLRFEGSRLGVSANVDLDLATQVATVQLSGFPLGGGINGTATLSDDGDPVLDATLEQALARRGVRVKEVDLDFSFRTCRVVASLPFARRLSITLINLDTV